MHPRKTLITAAIATASVVALTACSGGSGEGDGSVELTVSTWTANEPGLEDWWPELIEEFEAANEGVTVELQQIAYADYDTQITTQLTAQSAPEVIHVPTPTTTLPAWAEAGFLADLDAFLGTTDILEEWPDSQGVMAWDGTNYGALLVDYGYTLFYNEALLEEAGQEVPTTAEELLTAAQAVTDLPGDELGFAITADSSPNFLRDALVFVTGMEAPWIQDGAWNLTDPAVVEAFDVWRTLGADLSPQGTDIGQKREAFLTGNVAMMIEGPFYYSTIASSADESLVDSLHLATAPFSTQPGDVSHGLSIPAGLDDETQAAAESFVEFAASEEMMTSYSELVTSPVARPGAAEGLREDPETAPVADAAEDAVPIVSPELEGLRANYADFAGLAADHLQQLLQSDAPTEDVLAQFEQALTDAEITP